MSDLVAMHEYDTYIGISFDAGEEPIIQIGEKMNEICDEAYMNGYNWEAFLNSYLSENAPDILEELDTDPEAECYNAAINHIDDEGREMAKRLKDMIEDLFANEEKIYAYLEENAGEIEWD